HSHCPKSSKEAPAPDCKEAHELSAARHNFSGDSVHQFYRVCSDLHEAYSSATLGAMNLAVGLWSLKNICNNAVRRLDRLERGRLTAEPMECGCLEPLW